MPVQRRSARRAVTARSAIAALLLPVAVAVGCDDPVIDADPIVPVEALALLAGTGELGILAPQHANTLNSTTDCPGGGTIAVAGDVNDDPGPTITFDVKITASMCDFTSRGMSFRIDGSVDQEGAITSAEEENAIKLDVALDGDLDWWLAEKAGTCGIDVDIDASWAPFDSDGIAGPVTGKMCGHTVNADISDLLGD